MTSRTRSLRRIVSALIAISLLNSLSGCASSPVVTTQVEQQRIPEALTVACPVPQMEGKTYQSAFEYALALKASMDECNKRMAEIRAYSQQ